MTIYHIEFAKTGLGMSGGEKAMLETVKYFSHQRINNIILTTDNGKKAYLQAGLAESSHVNYLTISSFSFEKRNHIFASYLQRLPLIYKLIRTIKTETSDVIICHSNFFPNSFATALLQRYLSTKHILYWHHTLPPRIFRGYKGEFTNEWHFPNLALLHYHINQAIYKIIHKSGGIILTPSKNYLLRLRKEYSKNKIIVLSPYGGLDGDITVKVNSKQFDIAWMGRFQSLKGLDDLVEIIQRVLKKRPLTTFLVIGGGTLEEQESFQTKLNNACVESSVTYIGFVNDETRYEILIKARILAVTSYFESYGIVNIEALKLGLPIIAYDLPTYSHIHDAILRIPLGNIEKFAAAILDTLSDDEKLNKLVQSATLEGHAYSWAKTNKLIESALHDA